VDQGAFVDEDETKRAMWRRLELAGVAGLSATLLGLFLGQTVEQFVAQAPQPIVEAVKMQPRFNAIDYATTASIKGGTVVIGPCDTHKP
jgi:hypothetical protein